MTQLHKGVVKWFNNEKGFGFIENENGPDIFLHYSKIEAEGFKTVAERERVYYELAEGKKGPYASAVFPTRVIEEQFRRARAGVREIYRRLCTQGVLEVEVETDEQQLVAPNQAPDVAVQAHRF